MNLFKGGVHPYEGKEFTEDKSIIQLRPHDELVYPMAQHIGAPAKPVVKKGDTVLVGQLLGEPGGFVSAGVYSSVSGTVKAVELRQVANGTSVQSVVVENDYEYKAVEGYGIGRDYINLDRDAIIEILKNAGIVGMGGAGFPAIVKYMADPAKIDYILVNASECEPYLTSDYRVMLEYGDELASGLRILLKLFPNAKGVIGVEDNKPAAIENMRSITKDDANITVAKLRTRYPQGAERMLIYAITGRKINSKMLPADAGCVVSNVDTVRAVYNAVALSIPSNSRIVTVTGDAVVSPGNFEVPLGMSLREVLDAADGLKCEVEKIICGGPMMGMAIPTLDIPATKGTTALLINKKDQANVQATACIRCARCIEACPENLMPAKLATLVSRNNYDKFIELNGVECCACGCCTYVCPAKRPLAQFISAGRLKGMAILKSRKEK